jgi:hypothetical protein
MLIVMVSAIVTMVSTIVAMIRMVIIFHMPDHGVKVAVLPPPPPPIEHFTRE